MVTRIGHGPEQKGVDDGNTDMNIEHKGIVGVLHGPPQRVAHNGQLQNNKYVQNHC